jgi:voltage-gated potassium channel
MTVIEKPGGTALRADRALPLQWGPRRVLRHLYYGREPWARRFQFGLLAFDVFTILFFVVTSFHQATDALHVVEVALGIVLAIEFAARMIASRQQFRDFVHPLTIVDVLVIASLFAPAVTENLSFLRVLRALRLLRSYRVLKELRTYSAFFRRNEDLLFSMVHVMTFLFVTTALVFVLQVGRNPQVNNYVDALYYTVATLTTTGFGDITLVGTSGRLLSVLIMIFGISLFIRLVQTLFRPSKVIYECRVCGLTRHDPDAVHCKHCGTIMHIETEGE